MCVCVYVCVCARHEQIRVCKSACEHVRDVHVNMSIRVSVCEHVNFRVC